MSAKAIQMFSGADSVRAADAYRIAVEARRDAWPYVHVYPPPNAIDVNVIAAVVTQTQGDPAIAALTYQVNSGKRFFLQAVLLGSNVTFSPGDALFTLQRNSQAGSTQFMPEHGLINIPVQLGSSTLGPWRLHRAREFAPLDVITVQAVNVNLNAGTDQYVCGIFGYEVPTLDVKVSR